MPNKVNILDSNLRKISLIIYLKLKNYYEHKKGRSFKINILEQGVLTLFKLRYGLPDRAMERLFDIDHVTISRIILRISDFIATSNLRLSSANNDLKYYISTLRIGKGKNKDSFSGYKHYHGIKLQLLINDKSQIETVSNPYPASFHDKRIFLKEWKNINHRINNKLRIIGDKAYIGLKNYNLSVPIKKNELPYKNNKEKTKQDNKSLSSKRIKIEHVFAYIKKYRILNFNFYYEIQKLELFFKAVANLFNLSKL